jgi:hypothetical protein
MRVMESRPSMAQCRRRGNELTQARRDFADDGRLLDRTAVEPIGGVLFTARDTWSSCSSWAAWSFGG